MSVNAHLNAVAQECYVRDDERAGIDRSISHIYGELGHSFGDQLKNVLVFGSYARGTILPRKADRDSDVDLLVVFRDASHRPQTYLNRLRAFVGQRYSRSEVKQANPTIQLDLNHIRFELVPAIETIWSPFNIPAPASGYEDWLGTDPVEFNSDLVEANRANRDLVKPVVRVLKRWNAVRGYPFASYDLERQVVRNAPAGLFVRFSNVADGFYWACENLSLPLESAQWRREYLRGLQECAQTAKHEEAMGYGVAARQRVERLIPRL